MPHHRRHHCHLGLKPLCCHSQMPVDVGVVMVVVSVIQVLNPCVVIAGCLWMLELSVVVNK